MIEDALKMNFDARAYRKAISGWNWKFRKYLYKIEESSMDLDKIEEMINWFKVEFPKPKKEDFYRK